MAKDKSADKVAAKNGNGRTQRAPNVRLPEGVRATPLSNGLRPEGFLVVPTDKHPAPTTFVGILRAMASKSDAKRPDKPMVWGVFEAIGEQPGHVFDKETGETSPVSPGMLVGISRKGALHGMTSDKVGYLFGIEWTGKRIQLDGGRNPMWEILAVVSDAPYDAD